MAAGPSRGRSHRCSRSPTPIWIFPRSRSCCRLPRWPERSASGWSPSGRSGCSPPPPILSPVTWAGRRAAGSPRTPAAKRSGAPSPPCCATASSPTRAPWNWRAWCCARTRGRCMASRCRPTALVFDLIFARLTIFVRRTTEGGRSFRSGVQSSRPPAPQRVLRPARKYRESLRQPVLVIEQLAMLDVRTIHGPRRPFSDGHQFRQTCLALALLDLCVPLPEGFNDHLGKALPGFLSNRLGQTMGFRICDVETHGRSPILENPLQFYHFCKLAVPTCSRYSQLQVSERRSGNWILESRQGASNRGLRPMPDVSRVVALPYGVGRSYLAVCPANVSNARFPSN